MSDTPGSASRPDTFPAMPAASVPDRRLWIDGELVPWERATVHVLSHSLQRGSLVFDYLSVHTTPRGPAVFRLDEHVERFVRSTQLVGLPLEQSEAALRAAVLETVRANPGSSSVKMSAYLPSIEVDVVPVDDHVSVAIAAYDPGADILALKAGPVPRFRPTLRLWLEKERRNRRPDILAPQAKVAANYTSPMAAKWAARKQGYDEILLVDEHGFLAEGPTTNFFLVDRGGVVRTPLEGTVLHGVTRRSVIEIAAHDGRKVHEEQLTPAALADASEAFLTGTTAGVWPVESIDGRPIGAGAPGPVTSELRRRFIEVSSGLDAAFAHWLALIDGG
jgi:branched-chain amino acid aminotransferase